MSGDTPLTPTSIVDCGEHMTDRRQQDTSYFAELFEDKVMELDGCMVLCKDAISFV